LFQKQQKKSVSQSESIFLLFFFFLYCSFFFIYFISFSQQKKKKPQTKKMKSLVFIIAIIASFLMASCVVLAAPLTPGADTSPFTVTGVLTTQYHFGSSIGTSHPYYPDTRALLAYNSSGYCIVSRATGSTGYVLEWNFNTAESAIITSWLVANYLGSNTRNNLELTISGTWTSGRFTVTPTSWTITQTSIMPYGINYATCNVTRMLGCLLSIETSLPGDCANVLLPHVKSCVNNNPSCPALIGKLAIFVNNYCTLSRPVIDTLFCNDGSAGGTVVCDYVAAAKPTGIYAEVLITDSANGMPVGGNAGSQTTAPSSAGAVAFISAIASVLIAVIAMMM
jgi:hypothetical protein